jgi:hypothetical protein
MDHHVELKRLPDGLTFPPELSDRIHFDADRGKLSFRGFMCKAEFDRLGRLSDDWGYRRAMEDLFRLCTLEPPGRSPNRLAAIVARLVSRRDGSGG